MGRRRKRGLPRTSLRRRVGTRRPRKTLLVFCEGTQTEPTYLEALKREASVRDVAAVDIRVEKQRSGSVPLTLVRAAVDARSRNLEEEGEIDEFWCIFDVEWPRNHPELREARRLAEKHKIHVAVSNPCFELWLVLHFRGPSKWLSNDDARRLRRDCDGKPDKSIDAAIYMPRRHEAARRARTLDERHARNGTTFPKANPSSGMHHLLASVEPVTTGR